MLRRPGPRRFCRLRWSVGAVFRFIGSLVGVESRSAGCGVTGLSRLRFCFRRMTHVCLPFCLHVCLMYAMHPRPVPFPVIHLIVYSGPGMTSRSGLTRSWAQRGTAHYFLILQAAVPAAMALPGDGRPVSAASRSCLGLTGRAAMA